MEIGPIKVDTPVLLAPMAAVTDLPFRTICEEFGVGITVTEFLSAHALHAGAKKTVDKLTPSLNGRQFGVQIFGREDDAMTHAAKMAVDIGACLVDINMGCPAKRVTAGACGSALMREPELAAHLVKVVINAVPSHIPVTVKHRAGWDMQSINSPEFACAMVEAGAKMITVHGRTRSQGYSGVADLEIIRKTREAVPKHIPVVGNGDVVDVDGYFRMMEHTGADAVMIGRGARGNPWLFHRLKQIIDGNDDPGEPTLEERINVFKRHIDLMAEHKAGPRLIHEIRKACAWYARGLHGCNTFRQKVWQLETAEEVVECAKEYFDWLLKKGSRGIPNIPTAA